MLFIFYPQSQQLSKTCWRFFALLLLLGGCVSKPPAIPAVEEKPAKKSVEPSVFELLDNVFPETPLKQNHRVVVSPHPLTVSKSEHKNQQNTVSSEVLRKSEISEKHHHRQEKKLTDPTKSILKNNDASKMRGPNAKKPPKKKIKPEEKPHGKVEKEVVKTLSDIRLDKNNPVLASTADRNFDEKNNQYPIIDHENNQNLPSDKITTKSTEPIRIALVEKRWSAEQSIEDTEYLIDADPALSLDNDGLARDQQAVLSDEEALIDEAYINDVDAYIAIAQGKKNNIVPASKPPVEPMADELGLALALNWKGIVPRSFQEGDRRFSYCRPMLDQMRLTAYQLYSPFVIHVENYNQWQQQLGELSLVQAPNKPLKIYVLNEGRSRINLVLATFEVGTDFSTVLVDEKKAPRYFVGFLAFHDDTNDSLGGAGRFYQPSYAQQVQYFLIKWKAAYYGVKLEKKKGEFHDLEVFPLLAKQQEKQRNCRWRRQY